MMPEAEAQPKAVLASSTQSLRSQKVIGLDPELSSKLRRSVAEEQLRKLKALGKDYRICPFCVRPVSRRKKTGVLHRHMDGIRLCKGVGLFVD